ncbi:MAG: LysM peptidoglycan-binding domain-containing protein, partial [Chloroflexota bacterium]
MSARRLLPLIVLNIFVSAAVVLGILYWWDNRDGAGDESEAEVAAIPTMRATQAPLPTQPADEQPASEAESDVPSHTVQTGDTLGSISSQYDVSMDDIIAANDIDNPNFLQVGQVLIIPVGGVPADAPPATETPQPAEPPQPLDTQLPTGGEPIVEIADAVGVGQLDEEAILIKNSGETPIALLGWQLTDEDGRAYTFGQVTLFGEGAAITLH